MPGSGVTFLAINLYLGFTGYFGVTLAASKVVAMPSPLPTLPFPSPACLALPAQADPITARLYQE